MRRNRQLKKTLIGLKDNASETIFTSLDDELQKNSEDAVDFQRNHSAYDFAISLSGRGLRAPMIDGHLHVWLCRYAPVNCISRTLNEGWGSCLAGW